MTLASSRYRNKSSNPVARLEDGARSQTSAGRRDAAARGAVQRFADLSCTTGSVRRADTGRLAGKAILWARESFGR